MAQQQVDDASEGQPQLNKLSQGALTLLPQPIFDIESRQPSKTLIIAHVSPHIQDSVHSVNTLSYASPFKTSPPKPRGPAPYDPADPRTWTHEQTLAWLTEQFTKRTQVRVQHAQETRERDAKRNGKKALPPLDPAAPVPVAVDVRALCPSGMTAKHFGQMYTVEFVQRCLECATTDREFTPNVVKSMAAEVVGRMYYLILTAKTRKRKAIMSSRKAIDVDTYGKRVYLVSTGPFVAHLSGQVTHRWTSYRGQTSICPRAIRKRTGSSVGIPWNSIHCAHNDAVSGGTTRSTLRS